MLLIDFDFTYLINATFKLRHHVMVNIIGKTCQTLSESALFCKRYDKNT